MLYAWSCPFSQSFTFISKLWRSELKENLQHPKKPFTLSSWTSYPLLFLSLSSITAFGGLFSMRRVTSIDTLPLFCSFELSSYLQTCFSSNSTIFRRMIMSSNETDLMAKRVSNIVLNSLKLRILTFLSFFNDILLPFFFNSSSIWPSKTSYLFFAYPVFQLGFQTSSFLTGRSLNKTNRWDLW